MHQPQKYLLNSKTHNNTPNDKVCFTTTNTPTSNLHNPIGSYTVKAPIYHNETGDHRSPGWVFHSGASSGEGAILIGGASQGNENSGGAAPRTTQKRTDKELKVGTQKCVTCGEMFPDEFTTYAHMKSNHINEYMTYLDTELKDNKQFQEEIIREKEEYEKQVHQLTEQLEKVKVENKELNNLKKVHKINVKKTPGDSYDLEDEEELDSEREILKGKQNGYRRSGPQVQASQIFKCTQYQYQLKDKNSLEEHEKKALRTSN